MGHGSTMKIIPLFPCLLFECDVPIPDGLVDYCLELERTTPGVCYSNRGGWQSPGDLLYDEFFVDNYIRPWIRSIEEQTDLPAFSINRWHINVNRKGDSNTVHDHPNSDLSMVWYINASEHSGNISFRNPNSFAQYAIYEKLNRDILDAYNVHFSHWIPPRTGKCIFFPGHLLHEVEPNPTDEVRISMSANFKFIF